MKQLLGVGLALVLVSGSAAQQSTDHEAAVVGAVRATLPIRVDGRLDDRAWRAATPVTQFTQREPEEGSPISERTEVRIVYDEAAVYIGARLYEASRVSSRLGRRDSRRTTFGRRYVFSDLVWQQQRELEDAAGDLRLSRELSALGRAHPENVFVVKVSYWFNP